MVSIRDKFEQVLGNAEMMSEFNRLFTELVDECDKLNHIYVFSVELSVHGHIHLCVEISRYRSITISIPVGR